MMTKQENNNQEEMDLVTTLNSEENKLMNAQMVTLDIPFFIKNILKDKSWKKKDRNTISLYKSNGFSVVLVALKKGSEITKHIAKGTMAIQVIKGRIIFKTDDKSSDIRKGQMLALHPGIPHSALAKKKSIFLLILSIEK